MEDLSIRFQQVLAVENVRSTMKELLPGPEVEGDPFWVW